jgi:signal transduction histidine kinase
LSAEELSTHNVTLESHLPALPVMANFDADLLKQALLNVIQNGAQAMPGGGTLSVVLEEDRDSVRTVGLSRPGREFVQRPPSSSPGFAVLRIADQGPGIPEDIREKIFDLYFTTKSGGSGIGLAMTYRILQLHHGSVEVQSREGRGTEFLLRIPLAATDWGRRHPQLAQVEDEKGLVG